MQELESTKLPESVQQHIDKLEKVRRDFVANVSHELRTPLTVIQGYLEVLLDNDTSSNNLKIYQQMHEHSLRMGNLIEDLLLLSRLETNKLDQEDEELIDIKSMLETIQRDAHKIAEGSRNITLIADDTKLQGNRKEVKSLLTNLIINAVNYTHNDGDITIKWQKNEDKAIFEVIDNGIGIAKENIPRITERFFRANKARSRSDGGTGLGLAIVKHVALRHQAILSIESELGNGSRFSCEFPVERVIQNNSL